MITFNSSLPQHNIPANQRRQGRQLKNRIVSGVWLSRWLNEAADAAEKTKIV